MVVSAFVWKCLFFHHLSEDNILITIFINNKDAQLSLYRTFSAKDVSEPLLLPFRFGLYDPLSQKCLSHFLRTVIF